MRPSPQALPPNWLLGRLTRRRLLKALGYGGAALAGGAWVYNQLNGFGPPLPGNKVFDAREFDVVETIADAMFPGPPDFPYSAEQIRVPAFVDLYVSHLYEDTQHLFRLLVRTLNLSTVLSQGAAFRFLPLKRRQRALEEWGQSDLRVRRAGYQSLSFAINMGYYEDERVRRALGFTTGCEGALSPGRPDLWKMKANKS